MFLYRFCRQIDDLDLATLVAARPNKARSAEISKVMVITSQFALSLRSISKPYNPKPYMSRHFGHAFIETHIPKAIIPTKWIM